MIKYSNIACVADRTIRAEEILIKLQKKFGITKIVPDCAEEYDALIVLGGDGFMLRTLHQYMHLNIPFFGMNTGNFGFLLNVFKDDDIIHRIENSIATIINPLKMTFSGQPNQAKLAINEVSIIRSSTQAAKLKVIINETVRIEELICDGIIVSTPAGSTAYNFSVGGAIVPLGSNILSLTAISPFRPRRWKGALLSHNTKIRIETLEAKKRPVNAYADYLESNNVNSVTIAEDQTSPITILFDSDHSLEDRITREQFES